MQTQRDKNTENKRKQPAHDDAINGDCGVKDDDNGAGELDILFATKKKDCDKNKFTLLRYDNNKKTIFTSRTVL